jgi:hypothetical protein
VLLRILSVLSRGGEGARLSEEVGWKWGEVRSFCYATNNCALRFPAETRIIPAGATPARLSIKHACGARYRFRGEATCGKCWSQDAFQVR